MQGFLIYLFVLATIISLLGKRSGQIPLTLLQKLNYLDLQKKTRDEVICLDPAYPVIPPSHVKILQEK